MPGIRKRQAARPRSARGIPLVFIGWTAALLLSLGVSARPGAAQVPSVQPRPRQPTIQLSRETANAAAVTHGLPEFPVGFTFCRLKYDGVRSLRSGLGWSTDYPAAEHNFLTRFEELTIAPISLRAEGLPGYAAVEADDPDLFRCPFLFMTDPGSYDFSEREVRAMREYLEKGGFLWADDLWETAPLNYLLRNLARILPDRQVVELTPDHGLFSAHYVIPEVPQIPARQLWYPGGPTNECGSYDCAVPRMLGILDDDGRLMVLISHNTDIADGWEREGDDRTFFYTFSPRAYALGINVAIWVMTR